MMKAILVISTIVFSVVSAEAGEGLFDNSRNNQMMKECLDVYGYDKSLPVEERLNTFDWNAASSCVSGFNLEEQQKKLAELREFLKDKPWFRGKNWKWQERAEYTCTKQYHNGITVCRKPYYIN